MTPTDSEHPKPSRGPLSLVLPIRDAAPKLAAAVDAWRHALDKLGRDYEILVVGDGDAVQALAARHPNVRVVRHDLPRGFGACLRSGFAAAAHPNVAYAGPGHDPGRLKKLVEMLDQFDLVSTCRTGPVPNWLRRLDRVCRGFVRVVFGVRAEPRAAWRGWADWRRVQRLRWQFGVRLADPLSDFKVVRRSVLDRIAVQSDGDFVHAELLAKANFLGAMMAEVAIDPPPRDAAAAGSDYDAERRRVFRRPEFVRPAIPV